MDYAAIIHKDHDSDFGVSFPDFPGCITAGRTLNEAKDRALEALTGHLEVMRETGEAVPDPSSLDEVMRPPIPGWRSVSNQHQRAGTTVRVSTRADRRNCTRLASVSERTGWPLLVPAPEQGRRPLHRGTSRAMSAT